MTFKYIPRPYLHFDAPVGREAAQRLVTDSVKVARHSFYPFISFAVTTEKVTTTPEGKVVSKPPKVREILYSAHQDSHIFGYYSQLLGEHYERELASHQLGQSIIAFRPLRETREGRRVSMMSIHFANDAFEFIKQKGPCSVLAMDFSDFFGNLDHVLLKGAWSRTMGVERLPEDHYAVFKAITKYTKVHREACYNALRIDANKPREGHRRRLCTPEQFRNQIRAGGLCQVNRSGKGIPQGSPISAMLSNVYMLDFDKTLSDFVTSKGGFYRRYCDDILLVLPDQASRIEAEALVLKWSSDLRLPINEAKTERVDFALEGAKLTTKRPLQYLGFTFDGTHKRIRPASIARFYKKMRKGVGRAKAIRFRADRESGRTSTSRLKRRRLYVLYSYLGRHNFPCYAFRAARIMNEPGIKRQVKKHWRYLKQLSD